MERLILASNNRYKIKQIKEFFSNTEILTLEDIGYIGEIEETGETFFDNAYIKAKTISLFSRQRGYSLPVISEDSGLEVDALNGEPGVYSARYSGGNDSDNRKLLLRKLKLVKNRNAHYTACMIVYYPNDTYNYYYGKTYGCIIDEERGNEGFGYDSIFYSYDLKKTFGEASNAEKSNISHRGRAIKGLKELTKNRYFK